MNSLGLNNSSDLSGIYQKWIDAELQKTNTSEINGAKALRLEVSGSYIVSGEMVELREHQSPYSAVFDPENVTLRPENVYFGNPFDEYQYNSLVCPPV